MEAIYDRDIDRGAIEGKTIAIIGYGSQGRAHALNLRDSGCKVIVGLRGDSKSRPAAQNEGVEVAEVADAVKRADVVMMLIPDEEQPATYMRDVKDNLKAGRVARVRTRLRHSLRHDRAAGERRHVDVRAEGAGPHGPLRIRNGPRRAVPHRDPSRLHRQSQSDCRRVCERYRRRPRGRARNELPRRDRNRSVRRTSRALRRRDGARHGRFRNADRSRLRARDGVLRMSARTQADRRLDVCEGHRGHAREHQQHGEVRRLYARTAHRDGGDEERR